MKAPDIEIVNCKLCSAEVLSTKLPTHIDVVHSDETDRVREDAQDA